MSKDAHANQENMDSHPTLLDFPIEIFNNIFQSLSKPYLLAICLTCRTLRYLPEPVLYSHINWSWRYSQAPPIALLLRSIFSRPQLADFIQTFVLGKHYRFFIPLNSHEAPNISVTQGELKGPVAFVKSLKVHDQDLWLRDLEAGTAEDFLAVLVLQMPNLRTLRIDFNFPARNRSLGTVLRSALCTGNKGITSHGSSLFKRLQNMSLSLHSPSWREEYDNGLYQSHASTENVLPLFYLPALRHLSVSIDNPTAFSWPAQNPPTLSALTSLEISHLRENNLHQILSLTKGLRKLKWTWFFEAWIQSRQNQMAYPRIIDFNKISEALVLVRGTLIELSIGGSLSLEGGGSPPQTLGSLEAITTFPKLQRFTADRVMLNGSFYPPMLKPFSEILPKSLISLTITEILYIDGLMLMDTDLIEPLRIWLSNWKECTPNLESISILVEGFNNEWGPELQSELKKITKGAGISLEFTNNDD